MCASSNKNINTLVLSTHTTPAQVAVSYVDFLSVVFVPRAGSIGNSFKPQAFKIGGTSLASPSSHLNNAFFYLLAGETFFNIYYNMSLLDFLSFSSFVLIRVYFAILTHFRFWPDFCPTLFFLPVFSHFFVAPFFWYVYE